MNLTFRQLRAFREVMRFKSISEAARAIGRTQPSVSSMIANLEQELGFSLFLRQHGKLEPKPEAFYFLEEAEIVLDRLVQSTRTMREIGDLKKGQLKIACLPAASGFVLPREIAHFVRDRPNITVSLMMRSSPIVEELVASQQYDIGIAETPAPRNTIQMTSFEIDCVCAVHRNDPLAQETLITPMQLSGLPMAALARGHRTLHDTKAAFEEAGAKFFQRFELQTFLPALELVERRLCYTVCDMLTAASYHIYRKENPQIIFIPFQPAVSFSVAVLTPAQRPHSLLAKALAAQLEKSLTQIGNWVSTGTQAG